MCDMQKVMLLWGLHKKEEETAKIKIENPGKLNINSKFINHSF